MLAIESLLREKVDISDKLLVEKILTGEQC